MFARVENGVIKSCQTFCRQKKEKRNFGLKFSTLFMASCCWQMVILVCILIFTNLSLTRFDCVDLIHTHHFCNIYIRAS